MSTYRLDKALIDGDIVEDVEVTTVDGVISNVGESDGTGVHLDGLVLPGLANAHSHAFHRALRSRTNTIGGGSFWTWRDLMYEASARLDPDSYLALARAVFAEMLEAGYTAVGEFHYLHHQSDGRPYADPNAMSLAVLEAASEVGIRLTLIQTLYLHGGLDADGYSPLAAPQRRFSDGSADRFLERTASIPTSDLARSAIAIHSVRAVDPESIEIVAGAIEGAIHIHLSEQIAENTQCLAAHDRTPTQVLSDAGMISSALTAVHATHLTPHDIDLLGSGGVSVCLCPTTERDLADGIGPGAALAESGASLCLGSDSHAIIDPFEEMRAMEMHERLDSRRRGAFTSQKLLTAGTSGGYEAIGWSGGGRIAVGAPADLVCVGLESRRLAGADPARLSDAVAGAATSCDVTDVVVAGRHVVSHGSHVRIDTGDALDETIRTLLG